MSKDLARELYRTFRSHNRKNPNNPTEAARSKNEDPLSLSTAISELVTNREWKRGIAEGTLFTEWRSVVGAEIADHANPLTLVDGRLTIQTTSTAWATQLSLISPQLLKTIANSAPGALVEEISVIGPHAPNWKKGLRTIRGAKGPRDTYN